MNMTKTNDYNDDLILQIIVIASICIQIILEVFSKEPCSTPSPKKLHNPSATLPSHPKKVQNSSKQKSTTALEQPKAETTPTQLAAVSTATRRASSGATGSRSTAKKTLKVGTTSQATKTSKRGASIQSALPQQTTKSSPITQTPGSHCLV
jgi:hypothetical protein